jgi:putative nucleotidyltransferase with HDIG domain
MGFDLFDMVWFGNMSDVAAREAAAVSKAAAVARIHGLRFFPATARRVLQLTTERSTDLAELARVVASDPALAASTLHLANAIKLAESRTCSSIDEGVQIVGPRRLRHVTLSAVRCGGLADDDARTCRIIAHSVTVAEVCRELARPLRLPPEEMYACGLLHDLGKLMLLHAEGPGYASMLDRYDDADGALHVQERERFGFDHGIVAGQLLADWLIPPDIARAVGAHHGVAATSKRDAGDRVLVVNLADRLARSADSRPDADFFERHAESQEAVTLGLTAAMLSAVWPGAPPPPEMPAGAPSCRVPSVPPLRSRRPSRRSWEEPGDQPCAICGEPSLAASCPRCGSWLCPAHEPRRTSWCIRCENEFQRKHGLLAHTGLVLGTLTAASSSLGAAAALSGAPPTFTGAFILCALVVSSVSAGWLRWNLRARFLREEPGHGVATPHARPSRAPTVKDSSVAVCGG